jgi:Ferritin-like
VIDTREELIDALTEASELEHGLLIQYLFAALSLKKRADEGLSPEEQELVRRWEGQILRVARDEMGHLGTACNLLAAIGAAPRLGRPNFPQPATAGNPGYYPFDFQLAAFSDETLFRFVRAELPEGEPPPKPPAAELPAAAMAIAGIAPDPLQFKYIGELYHQIEAAFATLPESELFIGPRSDQDVDTWSRGMRLHLVVDRASAKAAIDAIVLEGEGAPAHREGSHYATFLAMREALHQRPGLKPARPVARNPRTRDHRDAREPGTLITNASTRDVAELFNAAYAASLLMLMQYYSFGGESSAERDVLRASIRQMMSMALRPLAEILTEMPIADDPTRTAGPPFELYGDLRLSTQRESRWTLLRERLDSIAGEARRLAGVSPRLAFIGENVALIAGNIRAAHASGGN